MNIYNNIDFEDKPIGLIRQNAMTIYQKVHSFLIEAICFENNETLHYLVRCKDNKWIQISIKEKKDFMDEYKLKNTKSKI